MKEKTILKKDDLAHVSGGDEANARPVETVHKKASKGPRCERCGSVNITRKQSRPTVIRETCDDCGHVAERNGVL